MKTLSPQPEPFNTDNNASLESLSNIQQWYGNWKDVEEKDLQNLNRLLLGGTLTVPFGGILNQFEKRFASFAGAEFGVAFNNGTASIYAALWALGIGPGDEVLACDYGYHGMGAALATVGARLVPCDIDPDSLCLDPQSIESRLTPRSKAVLLHHPWGNPSDIEAIRAASHLPIISDASHAHGALYRGKPLGAWADITCYSLGMRKLITGGELGCAVTNDPELRDRMIQLGHVKRAARDIRTFDWTHDAVGLKLRPHVAALAMAVPQIKRYDEKKSRLRETCAKLENGFREAGFIPQKVASENERVYWRLVFRIDPQLWGSTPINAIEEALREEGLPVEHNHYWPLLQDQAPYQWEGNQDKVVHHQCPKALQVVPRLITLPAPVTLPDSELERAIAAAHTVAARFR